MSQSDSKPYIIVGCQATGETHPRLDIKELVHEDYQFSLFIRALTKIQEPDFQPKPASFREIAGIHGLPHQVWSGDVDQHPENRKESKQWLGYCYHSSVLFPSWHRVVMMLIEQSISEVSLKLAAEDEKNCRPEQKGKWTEAAKKLRFPYWNWTDSQTGVEGLPTVNGRSIFGSAEIPIFSVKSLDDKDWPEVSNPLFKYDFGSTLPAGFEDHGPESYFGTWKRTYRWPTEVKDNPKEQYDLLNKSLTGEYHIVTENGLEPYQPWRWLSRKVKMMFTLPPFLPHDDSPSLWDRFSNTNPQERRVGTVYVSGSIEEPHNKVHNNAGANGHMGDPDYAGFDPIFYMHHCNVDRILAFWEAVYPDYWMGKNGWYDNNAGNRKAHPFTGLGTLVQPEGSIINEDTELAPFKKKNNEYWTSKDTRFLHSSASLNKYYTYKPINGVSLDKPLNNADREKAIPALQHYFDPEKVKSYPFSKLPPIFSKLHRIIDSIPDNTTIVEKYRQFIIHAELHQSSFKGSYNLEVYLETDIDVTIPDKSTGEPVVKKIPAQTIIDTISVFARKDPSHCTSCAHREAIGSTLSGIAIIPSELVIALIRMRDLDKSERTGAGADAEFFGHLKGLFGVRIVRPDGKVLAKRDLAGDSVERQQPEVWWPKLKLLSAGASNLDNRSNGDSNSDQYYLQDWAEHDSLLGDGWRKV